MSYPIEAYENILVDATGKGEDMDPSGQTERRRKLKKQLIEELLTYEAG